MRARSIAAVLRRLRTNDAGVLTVEFAFLLPVLAMLSFGALEVGHIFLEHLRITGMARAGLQYGLRGDVAAADTDGIVAAARLAAGGAGAAYDVLPPEKYYSCTGADKVADPLTGCPDGQEIRTYLAVTVEGEVPTLLAYPSFMPSSIALASRQVQRLN